MPSFFFGFSLQYLKTESKQCGLFNGLQLLYVKASTQTQWSWSAQLVDLRVQLGVVLGHIKDDVQTITADMVQDWISEVNHYNYYLFGETRISVYLDLCMNFGHFEPQIRCILDRKTTRIRWLATMEYKNKELRLLGCWFCCSGSMFLPSQVHIA